MAGEADPVGLEAELARDLHVEDGERDRQAATAFEDLVQAIESTSDRAGEISMLTAEQRELAERVVGALERISGIAHRNAQGTEEASDATQQQTASMRQMATSAHILARTSDQLKDLIAIFKLR